MLRRLFLCVILICGSVFVCFGQTAALRDYVGMISQSFHPDAVSFLEKLKTDLEKRGYTAAARSLDAYIKGDSGTGFVYVAANGSNYILTNYHVISQAQTLTITFEKQNGEQTKFSDLTIIAADEDMDIALLRFAGSQNPFREGLRFISRPVQEGDDVFSAGFPGLGTSMIWQFGRGMISNASVRLPLDDDSGKMLGPFIQHTAQVDPGNSGGPLLVQTAGVPTGYAVAGINTLKAYFRQAANYSIPADRVQTFLNASLNRGQVNERSLLETRLESFMEGLNVNRAVYPHITSYLSNVCTGENAEFAMNEMLAKAPRSVQNNILSIFGSSPVEGMSQAVGWLIENQIRSRTGSINITTESITPNGSGFTVTFNINDKTITSEWVNEYGIWRIYKFGEDASGNKDLLSQRTRQREQDEALKTDYNFTISAGYSYIFGYESSAFYVSASLKFISSLSIGFEMFFGDEEYSRLGPYFNLTFPIRLNSFAIMPFGELGLSFTTTKDSKSKSSGGWESHGFDFAVGFSFKGGLMFTFDKATGLFLRTFYQHNIITMPDGRGSIKNHGNIGVGIGYGF